jgi:phosphotransferase system HPr (HPr) family protein
MISDPAIRLLTMLAHDIRTPLQVMTHKLCYLQLKLDGRLDDEERSALGSLHSLIQAILDPITQILDQARVPDGQLVYAEGEFALDDFLAACVDEVQPLTTEKGLLLHVDLQVRQTIRSDRAKLHHVVNNLLSNAIRYTEKGHVAISSRTSERRVHIDIEDTGIGIAPEEQSRIFDEHYRIGPERGGDGYGLGLAIAAEMARLMGGELTVRSKLGKGSRFSFSLPAEVLVSPETAGPASPITAASPGTKHTSGPAPSSPVSGPVKVVNESGIHLRAAQKFAELAKRFQAEVRVVREDMCVNGKSILDVMTLAAGFGAIIVIEAHGPDAADAVRTLSELVMAGFAEASL